MAKAKKQEAEIKTDGWKDTFSDLMNLLLCFFVLLYSMSSVDEAKYEELVASLSNSFNIFSGGAQSLQDGQLISSGAAQLNNLDEYYTDIGKTTDEDSDETTDPMAELEEKQQEEQKDTTEELYSDVVEQSEIKHLEDTIDVTMDEGYQYVMISLSGGVIFDSGSDQIRSGAKPILRRVSDILKKYSDHQIMIEGHTDNVPISNAQFPSNLWLSTARATRVLEYFVESKGLNEKNMEASGRGDVDPVANNGTAEGRSKNRRVEIKIYSSTK